MARAKLGAARVRPRWRLFGLFADWSPGDLVATRVAAERLAVAAVSVATPSGLEVGRSERTVTTIPGPESARSETLRPFGEAGPAMPLVRTAEKEGTSALVDGTVLTDGSPPDTLGSRLYAILQPPIEKLLSKGGVLEWPSALLPHQVEGVQTLLQRRELLLADDMGLGKTIQVLAALRVLFHRQLIQHALVVAPASLTRQWQREAAKWAPELRTKVVSAPAAQRAALWRLPAHVTIVGYETLREDVSLSRTTPPTENTWDVVVLDEASKIKNRESRVSRAAKRVPRDRRWALTGTPLETSIEDVRSILEFLLGEAGTPAKVPRAHAEVKESLKANQLRRKKADVLEDLPSKTVVTVELELPPSQREAYDTAEGQGIVQLRSRGAKVRVAHVLELIVRLKQICNRDPGSGESAKLQDIEERMDVLTAEGHRALLFTQFTDETFGAAMVSEQLSRFAPLPYTGAMSAPEKQAAEDRFRNDEARKLMVLSLRAGGMGLNLQSASYVFHLDRWWNPAIEDQAEARSHRMGQRWPVTVYRYVCLGTIEERIERILSERRNLFAEMVDDVSLDLGAALSTEELFGLFNLPSPSSSTRGATPFGDLSGEEFEEWLSVRLEAQGFSVRNTPRSKDGGIDLIASKSDMIGIESRLLIQCKNHSYPIGVQVVRELRGVVRDPVPGATPVVASPSGFTRDARDFAEANGIVLWDEADLQRLVTERLAGQDEPSDAASASGVNVETGDPPTP